MNRWHFRLSCLVLMMIGSLAVAGELKDEKLGFRVTIPDGFKPEPSSVHGDTVYAYVRAEDSTGAVQAILIEKMGGIIGRESIASHDVSKLAPQASVSQLKWKSFDVDVIRMPQQKQGIDIVVLTAQVPLKHEAIQLAVAGEKSNEPALWDLLKALLASLEGESNWLSTGQRIEKAMNALYGLGVVVAVIVIVVVWFVRRGRKRRQRNNELAINYPVD
jgi:hypothetical protein